MTVTKLAGSASLQFVHHTAVGVYIRPSRYAEVINRRINTPIALKELMPTMQSPLNMYRVYNLSKEGLGTRLEAITDIVT